MAITSDEQRIINMENEARRADTPHAAEMIDFDGISVPATMPFINRNTLCCGMNWGSKDELYAHTLSVHC